MKYLYMLVILQLFLNDTTCRIKLTKITNNLTLEVPYSDSKLLPKKSFTRQPIPYVATLFSGKRKRIIGGDPIDIKQQPSTAYLLVRNPQMWSFRGGAVIIGRYWAVTAGHCLEDILDEIQRGWGFVCSNTSHWKKGCNRHKIIRHYIHKKYNKDEADYDIGLVKVKQPFNAKYEKPIKWATNHYKYLNNKRAVVLGWGTTNPNRQGVSDVLRATTIRIIDQNTCRKRYGEHAVVTNRMICAFDKGKDACDSDSGGPLVQNKILIGLVSWGPITCATNNYPGVYTKVSFFNGWLRNKMGIKSRTTRKTQYNLVFKVNKWKTHRLPHL